MNAREPEFTDKTRVSADEIRLLCDGSHGTLPKQKSYVNIGTKSNLHLASLPVHNGYVEFLPNFVESMLSSVLDEDAYFTVNCMFRSSNRLTQCAELKDILGPDDQRIMAGYRERKGISRLNACFVDIDCHKLGLTHGQVVGRIYDLSRSGDIPTPTYLKDSGRGLWVFWLLGREPRHFPNHVDSWDRIQTKLACLFQGVGADHNAKDAARLTRMLGSLNTKVNRRVNFLVFGRDTSGEPIRYTLAELAAHLGMELRKPRQPRIEGFVNPKNKQKGIQGQEARWKLDEERFWTLAETIRHEVPVGTRHAHNLVIGSILRHRWKHDPKSLDIAIADAASRLWKLHPRTDKDFSRDRVEQEILHAANGMKTGVKMTQQHMANTLEVTTAEAEKIRTIVLSSSGGTWPPAKGQDPLPKMKLSRAEKTAAVKAILTDNKNFPGYSDQAIADRIGEEYGLPVSRETIRQLRPKTTTIDKPELPMG